MKLNWRIREALPTDADELQSSMESAYGIYVERLSGTRLPPMDLDYENEIREFPTWVVECDNRVVGGLTMLFGENHAVLANIGVHMDCQGLGIGGGLMKYAEKKAREKNFPEIRLATHVLLEEIVSLYLHLGWKETKRDETRVYMKKDL